MLLLSLAFAAYLFALWKRPLLYAGLVLQASYIISRGIDPHDTIALLSASLVAFGIPFGLWIRDKENRYFEFITSIAAVFKVFALTSKQHNSPLPPVLKTIWFECHVVLAFMSYALFGI